MRILNPRPNSSVMPALFFVLFNLTKLAIVASRPAQGSTAFYGILGETFEDATADQLAASKVVYAPAVFNGDPTKGQPITVTAFDPSLTGASDSQFVVARNPTTPFFPGPQYSQNFKFTFVEPTGGEGDTFAAFADAFLLYMPPTAVPFTLSRDGQLFTVTPNYATTLDFVPNETAALDFVPNQTATLDYVPNRTASVPGSNQATFGPVWIKPATGETSPFSLVYGENGPTWISNVSAEKPFAFLTRADGSPGENASVVDPDLLPFFTLDPTTGSFTPATSALTGRTFTIPN